MATYTVLQTCRAGRFLHLAPANYGESFPSYSLARKFASKTNFLYGIVRTDRVDSVRRAYRLKNN